MPTCTWPDGGCGAPVIFVPSATTGRKMILDAKPEKRVVVGEPVLGLDHTPVLVGGSGTAASEIALARVADVYTDHHGQCPAFELYQQRQRAAKAGQP
jgi:hypothetical protein